MSLDVHDTAKGYCIGYIHNIHDSILKNILLRGRANYALARGQLTDSFTFSFFHRDGLS